MLFGRLDYFVRGVKSFSSIGKTAGYLPIVKDFFANLPEIPRFFHRDKSDSRMAGVRRRSSIQIEADSCVNNFYWVYNKTEIRKTVNLDTENCAKFLIVTIIFTYRSSRYGPGIISIPVDCFSLIVLPVFGSSKEEGEKMPDSANRYQLYSMNYVWTLIILKAGGQGSQLYGESKQSQDSQLSQEKQKNLIRLTQPKQRALIIQSNYPDVR